MTALAHCARLIQGPAWGARLLAVACGMVAAAATAATSPSPRVWADFVAGGLTPGGPRVASIALAEMPGDVQVGPLSFGDRMVKVTGRIANTSGSQWVTLGLEVASDAAARPQDLSAYQTLRIRLASNAPRDLRIRLKGPDLELQAAGCYPVVFQRVAAAEVLDIPLAGFSPEAYCGERGASVSSTLKAMVAVEVTANEPDASPVWVGVGRVEFVPAPDPQPGLAAGAAVGAGAPADAAPELLWADEFNAAAGATPDEALWLRATPGAPLAAATHDGRGQLIVQPPLALQQRDESAFLYGRVEVRARLPQGGGARLALRAAPPAGAARGEEGQITLVEAAEGRLQIGASAPGLTASQWLPAEVGAGPLNEGWHDFAVTWDPQQIQWLVDGQVVKTLPMRELAERSRAAFGRWPFVVRIEAGRGGGVPLLLDHLRVHQGQAQQRAGRQAVAAWLAARGRASARSGTPAAAVHEAPRGRPQPAAARPQAPPPSTSPSASSTPPPTPRAVACERNKLGLMMCY